MVSQSVHLRKQNPSLIRFQQRLINNLSSWAMVEVLLRFQLKKACSKQNDFYIAEWLEGYDDPCVNVLLLLKHAPSILNEMGFPFP